MIVLDKNGQNTELFNQYDSDVLMPAIETLVANAAQFLDENGADPIDFRLLEGVIMDGTH